MNAPRKVITPMYIMSLFTEAIQATRAHEASLYMDLGSDENTLRLEALADGATAKVETELKAYAAQGKRAGDAMTSAMAKCDDAIIDDLNVYERGLLAEAYAHETSDTYAPAPDQDLELVKSMRLAGLMEDGAPSLTPRGQRIARRLAA